MPGDDKGGQILGVGHAACKTQPTRLARLRVTLMTSSDRLLAGSAPDRRLLWFRRRHPLAEPICNHACDLHAVLLQHQLVAISFDADIVQPNEILIDSSL